MSYELWPSIERALIVFSGVDYLPPTILWYTEGGYIYQDVVDGCADIKEMFPDWPKKGLWIWEGVFDNGYYEGSWREPNDDEWIMIIQQQNPWRQNEQ